MNGSSAAKRTRSVSLTRVQRATLVRGLSNRKATLRKICDLPEKDALLNEINAVLDRISQGDYGRCVTCNEQIPWAILLPNPFAQHCYAHQNSDEHHKFFEDDNIRARVSFRFSPQPGAQAGERLERFGPVREEIAKDALLASSLQSALLPQPGLRLGPWETSYSYAPARTVSGDYCDLIADVSSGELFFCFGDGMGKGLLGSLISSSLHSLFRTLVTLRHEETLNTMVECANRVLCEEFCRVEFGCYATVIFGRALDNGTIEFVNAGHPPAFLVRSGGVALQEATGLPLGLFYTSTYEVKKVLLDQREALLMYTDGITEARDSSGTEYGSDRLEHIAEQQKHLSAEALVDVCVRDLNAFTADGPLIDDRTIMVIRRM